MTTKLNICVLKLLFAGLLVFRISAMAEEPDPRLGVEVKHATVGRAMDTYYYDAGTRVDIAKFDLRELVRQGRDVPDGLVEEIEEASAVMRARWLELENSRVDVYDKTRMATYGRHVIEIEFLAGHRFGFRSAKILWPDGAAIAVPLLAFRGGHYAKNFSIHCERSPAVHIAGTSDENPFRYRTAAGLDLEELPPGDAELIISGLDGHRVGRRGYPRHTRIRVSVNDHVVFEGRSPFGRSGWSEHGFIIPASVFQHKFTLDMDMDQALGLFDALAARIDEFGGWAAGLADRIDESTRDLRYGLEYIPLDYSPDYWQKNFMRMLKFVSHTGPYDGTRPSRWFHDNYEYVAKAFRDSEVSIALLYLIGDYHKICAEFENAGLPFLQEWRVAKGGSGYYNTKFAFIDRHQLMKDMDEFAGLYSQYSGFAGVRFNEPYIIDTIVFHEETGRVLLYEHPEIRRMFAEYLGERGDYLEDAGVRVPDDPVPVTEVQKPEDLPLWMEWQMFKKELMAEHYKRIWRESYEHKGILSSVVIMNQGQDNPQASSYVSMGRLPLIETDPYVDATITEAFVMQLLRSATDGKAIMTAGSGYSARTPDRYRRNLAIGMTHADGINKFMYLHCSKYRDPAHYWRTGGRWPNRDDLDRDFLTNWRPEYWDIHVEMYKKMAAANEYLTDTESVADVVVLHSERTAILDSPSQMKFHFGNTAPFQRNRKLYSYLVARHRPVDAAFIEVMTPERMARYNVAVLANARSLTPGEIEVVRGWVQAGGTLIAADDVSLADEWGRMREDFALADIFGAHYIEDGKRVDTFSAGDGKIKFDSRAPYRRVALSDGAAVRGVWETGDPALIENEAGLGRIWFFTGKIANAPSQQEARIDSALLHGGHPDMIAFLSGLVEKSEGVPPAIIANAPEGLEVHIRKKDDEYIIHLLDWHDERILADLMLRINLPGEWQAVNPFTGEKIPVVPDTRDVILNPFSIYEMVVLKPE